MTIINTINDMNLWNPASESDDSELVISKNFLDLLGSGERSHVEEAKNALSNQLTKASGPVTIEMNGLDKKNNPASLSTKALAELSKILSNNQTLTSIKFKMNNAVITAETISVINNILSNNQTLSTVEFIGLQSAKKAEISTLVESILCNSKITKVIGLSAVPETQQKIIQQQMTNNQKDFIGDTKKIAEELQKGTLESVVNIFNANHLALTDIPQAEAVFNALQDTTPVTVLNLLKLFMPDCSINTTELLTAIPKETSELVLNRLNTLMPDSPDTATAVLKALQEKNPESVLNLLITIKSDFSGEKNSILDALQKNTPEPVLNIDGAHLKQKDIEAIINALTKTKVSSISFRNLDENMQKAILNAFNNPNGFKSNQTIQAFYGLNRLRLRDQKTLNDWATNNRLAADKSLQEAEQRRLAESTPYIDKVLKELNIDFVTDLSVDATKLSNDDLIQLAKALNNNTTLVSLTFDPEDPPENVATKTDGYIAVAESILGTNKIEDILNFKNKRQQKKIISMIKTTGYTLCLASEHPEIQTTKPDIREGILYLESIVGGHLQYTLKDPVTLTKKVDKINAETLAKLGITLDVPLTKEIFLTQVMPKKSEIQKITNENGHTKLIKSKITKCTGFPNVEKILRSESGEIINKFSYSEALTCMLDALKKELIMATQLQKLNPPLQKGRPSLNMPETDQPTTSNMEGTISSAHTVKYDETRMAKYKESLARLEKGLIELKATVDDLAAKKQSAIQEPVQQINTVSSHTDNNPVSSSISSTNTDVDVRTQGIDQTQENGSQTAAYTEPPANNTRSTRNASREHVHDEISAISRSSSTETLADRLNTNDAERIDTATPQLWPESDESTEEELSSTASPYKTTETDIKGHAINNDAATTFLQLFIMLTVLKSASVVMNQSAPGKNPSRDFAPMHEDPVVENLDDVMSVSDSTESSFLSGLPSFVMNFADAAFQHVSLLSQYSSSIYTNVMKQPVISPTPGESTTNQELPDNAIIETENNDILSDADETAIIPASTGTPHVAKILNEEPNEEMLPLTLETMYSPHEATGNGQKGGAINNDAAATFLQLFIILAVLKSGFRVMNQSAATQNKVKHSTQLHKDSDIDTSVSSTFALALARTVGQAPVLSQSSSQIDADVIMPPDITQTDKALTTHQDSPLNTDSVIKKDTILLEASGKPPVKQHASPEKTVVNTNQPVSPSNTETRWNCIYANIPETTAEARATKYAFDKLAFKDPANVNDNFPVNKANQDELYGSGMTVTSPAGLDYSLSVDSSGTPKAVLKNDAIFKDDTPTEKQERQAITIMNMIDNLVSHCTVVNTKTNNAYLATFANLYIKHLNDTFSLNIEEVRDDSTPTPSDEAAIAFFNTLKSGLLAKTSLEQAPAIKQAIEFRKQLPDGKDLKSKSMNMKQQVNILKQEPEPTPIVLNKGKNKT